jgi:predicted Zn-dependent peptidase
MKKITQPYTTAKLDSGLTVVRVPMAGISSITVLALVRVGSRQEPVEWAGIAHFLEHMVFKGTAAYPTAKDLSSTLDRVGANFNAFTSKEYTGYYVHAASDHAHIALDVVSDMLLTPVLREEDYQREKGVIIEELNMYLDTPMRHVGEVFEEVLYGENGLGRGIIGLKKTIMGMTRDAFVSYLKTWYGLQNVVLVVAGDTRIIESAAFSSDIQKSFSKKSDTADRSVLQYDVKNLQKMVLDDGGSLSALEESAITIPQRPRKDRILVQYKKTDQAHFVLGVEGYSRGSKERYALAVLQTLFGGMMSSRLFTEVREKRGLCYYVHSDLDVYHETGVFGASAGVDPKRANEAVAVVLEEFLHLGDASGKWAITEEELQKAKDHLIGQTALGMEDSESVASFYGMRALLTGEIETPSAMLENLRKVTLNEVRSVAQILTKRQVHAAMIGPFKHEKMFAVVE